MLPLAIALAPVPAGGDETITPGQRILILLSGRYNNDALSILPNPPSIGGCKYSVIDTSPGRGLPQESGSGGACLPFPSPTHTGAVA